MNTPQLFTPLVTPDEMQHLDTLAQTDFGMPEAMLIENAAREAWNVLQTLVSLTQQSMILVFAGKGNNGADGIALARHLHNAGHRVLVLHTHSLNEASEGGKTHVQMAQRIGLNFLQMPGNGPPIIPLEWRYPSIVIDALCGTGLKGILRFGTQQLVHTINQLANHSFIFSLDVPTGLCSITGTPMPVSVQASATLTFEVAKPGLYLQNASNYTGNLFVRKIGLPTTLCEKTALSWQLIQPKAGAWAQNPLGLHKGAAGKVLIIGGSATYFGAPALAARGAMRCGAGMVHVVCPAAPASIQTILPEAIVHSLPSPQWQTDAAHVIEELITTINPGSILLGPGFGKERALYDIIRHILLLEQRPPLILDADALHWLSLAHEPDASSAQPRLSTSLLQSNDIITPHPGELRVILHNSASTLFPQTTCTASVSELITSLVNNRPKAVRQVIAHCPAVLVLKGAYTLVGKRNAPLALAPFDVPALATAGSGDVLAGILAALVARKMPACDASALGVYLHGRAGQLLQENKPRGVLASEIADMVPCVWRELCNA